MAAKKKNSNASSTLREAFAELSKTNKFSAPLSENALSVVSEYIDSGSMALNAIVAGSIYRGFPKGRITGLVGPSGCGKTLIINQAIANAQKKDPDIWAVVWDSENAFDAQMANNLGVNVDKVRHNPVETIEECRNQMMTFLNKIEQDKSLYGKIILVLDSLGNLASIKELADITAGKSSADMGLRAKSIKSMMRTLTGACARTNTTMLFSNHIYDDPSSLFPSMVKNQSGGKGPQYLASVLIQLALKQEKVDTKDSESIIPIANKVKGITMNAMTVKNRFVPPFLKTSLYLNFKSGLYKYAGLLEMALAYNIITQKGATYSLTEDGQKLGYYKNWKNNKEIWEKWIIPPLDEIIKKEFAFSEISTDIEDYNEEEIIQKDDEQ